MIKADLKTGVGYFDRNLVVKYNNLAFTILCILYQKGIPSRSYYNREGGPYCIHYFPRGKGKYHINDSTFDISPGTIVFQTARTRVGETSDPIDPMEEYSITFDVNITDRSKVEKDLWLYQKEVDTFFHILTQTDYKVVHNQNLEIMNSKFESILFELENQFLGWKSKLSLLIYDIIISTIRSFANTQEHKVEYSIGNSKWTRIFGIKQTLAYGYRDATLESVAKSLDISPRQLTRDIKEFFSTTFKKLLVTARLEKSVELLLTTDLDVSQIASEIGLDSTSHFHRLFRKVYNMTPAQYRLECKNNNNPYKP